MFHSGKNTTAAPSSPSRRNTARHGVDERESPRESVGLLRARVHYDDLLPEDVATVHGIPVTTPARTLLDLATVVNDDELEHALAEALRHELTDRSEILAVIARYPRHRGGPRLRTLIEAGPTWERR